jgi:hypothetical protein
MAGCMRWYDLSMFGQVDGKERERERERERGKKANSKTFFFPSCTSKEEEEECRSKHHCFGLLLLFLVFSPIL